MFKAENKLEESLIKAATDPSQRLDFYKQLSNSDIYFIQVGGDSRQFSGVLKKGENIRIHSIEFDGKPYLPIFTSLTRLRQSIQEEVNYISMNSLNFFEITAGADLLLNPGHDYGKQFTKAEIQSILTGSIFQPTETWKAENETQMLIGQPANYPTELVDGLKKFLSTRIEVKYAYLAHVFIPDRDEKPHTLIGIEADKNWNEIVAGAGMVVEGSEVPDPPVDFLRIKSKREVQNYFNDIDPFYIRKIITTRTSGLNLFGKRRLK